jgi:thymidylate synthase
MQQYLNDIKYILDNGTDAMDRTGTGTRSVFGMQTRYDLTKGFPAITTKKLAWKAVVSELLWFLEGSGDEGRLREILYGSRDAKTDHGVTKKTIWSDNASAPYWTPKAEFDGDLGRVYGVQWRHWRTYSHNEGGAYTDEFGTSWRRQSGYAEREVDQLLELVEGIKKDPQGRRHILTAWNPGELNQMALPPCHCFAQFYVRNNKLSCQMYQRSSDFFLGVPFNIASYALLTYMVAQVCGLGVGDFVHTHGDAHIYNNHIDQVNEQLSRTPYELPDLWLNPAVTDITKFTMADIALLDYKSHDSIKAPMAV